MEILSGDKIPYENSQCVVRVFIMTVGIGTMMFIFTSFQVTRRRCEKHLSLKLKNILRFKGGIFIPPPSVKIVVVHAAYL